MGRARSAHALLRSLDSTVRVNLRTGRIMHKPPPVVFEAAKNPWRPSPPILESASSLASEAASTVTDSIIHIEAGLRAGEMRATAAIRRSLRTLEREEEKFLLEEAEQLGLA